MKDVGCLLKMTSSKEPSLQAVGQMREDKVEMARFSIDALESKIVEILLLGLSAEVELHELALPACTVRGPHHWDLTILVFSRLRMQFSL